MAPRRGWPLGYALLCGQLALLAILLLPRGAARGARNGSEPHGPGAAPPAASWAYSDPRAPLVLCTHL